MLDEVEAAILGVAASIMRGEGFTYDVPSRAKGNQLYVPQLDRIVLRDSVSHRSDDSNIWQAACAHTHKTCPSVLSFSHVICLSSAGPSCTP